MFHGFLLSIHRQKCLFVMLRKRPHARISHHDIHSFLESVEHIVLDVWDTILFANRFDLRGGLLVAAHAEIWPQVVLNLVIEKAMKKVDNVGTIVIIDGRQDLTKAKASGERTARTAETVHIITSMVSDDTKEPVQIGENVRQKYIGDGVPVHLLTRVTIDAIANKEPRERSKKEMEQQVGSQHDGKELRSGIERILPQ